MSSNSTPSPSSSSLLEKNNKEDESFSTKKIILCDWDGCKNKATVSRKSSVGIKMIFRCYDHFKL